MFDRLQEVQHEPCAVGPGEMRDIQHDVVGGRIEGVFVEMLAHEANALAVDFFQLAGGTTRVVNSHLLAKRCYPPFERCDEPYL